MHLHLNRSVDSPTDRKSLDKILIPNSARWYHRRLVNSSPNCREKFSQLFLLHWISMNEFKFLYLKEHNFAKISFLFDFLEFLFFHLCLFFKFVYSSQSLLVNMISFFFKLSFLPYKRDESFNNWKKYLKLSNY